MSKRKLDALTAPPLLQPHAAPDPPEQNDGNNARLVLSDTLAPAGTTRRLIATSRAVTFIDDGNDDAESPRQGTVTPTESSTNFTNSRPPRTPARRAEPNSRLQSTPQIKKLLGTVPHASNIFGKAWSAEAIRVKLFHETKKYFIGYMNPETFLEEFLPWNSTAVDPPAKVKLPAYKRGPEAKMYERFVSFPHLISELRSHSMHRLTRRESWV
jgi:hypothetical protein